MRLSDQVELVTGAGQGIGAAIADLLESEGALVARTDLKGTDIELDVTDRASVERGVTHVVESLGEPTVLVNNAGVLGVAPSDVQEEERWQTVLDVNLTGVFASTSRPSRPSARAAGPGRVLRCCQVVGRR